MFKKFLNKKIKVIETTNPENFTPKKLKEFFGILPIWLIKIFCNMAVREGLYVKNYNEKGEVYYSLKK